MCDREHVERSGTGWGVFQAEGSDVYRFEWKREHGSFEATKKASMGLNYKASGEWRGAEEKVTHSALELYPKTSRTQ